MHNAWYVLNTACATLAADPIPAPRPILFSAAAHIGFESEKVRKKGLLKVLKKVVGKKKDF